MPETLLILRYRLRAFMRGVRAYGFEIFVLGPVIMGGALWVGHRHLALLRETLARTLTSDAGDLGSPANASLALALGLFVLQVPGTFRELYASHRTDGFLEPLPVPRVDRFHAAIGVELARSMGPIVVLLLAASALAGQSVPSLETAAGRTASLMVALTLLGLLRFSATLLVVHWKPGKRRATAGLWLMIAVGIGLALWPPHPAFRLLLLPWWAPAAHLEKVFLGALQIPPVTDASWTGIGALAATGLVLYLLARSCYLSWHQRDLERAGRLIAPPERQRAGWLSALGLRPTRSDLTRPLAVQVARDVKLVLRRFSPAVLLCAGCTLLTLSGVLTLLFDTTLPDLWRQRLAVVGLTLAVLTMVSLVPFLLKYQLPRFWIEKSTGVDLEQIWKAKLWTAGLLALGPFAFGVAILSVAPLSIDAKAAAVLQLTAAAWIVTSIVGLAVFEIAAQPLLGLVFGSLVGLALAALFAFYPQAWWLWAVFYLYVASQIAGRATRRVRLVETSA